jgi:hypothetical protein
VCNNAECGHSFVMHLEFAHTLSPSGLETQRKPPCIIFSTSLQEA